jgi:ATP-dependent Clp protease ATP-binding subunit ClpA
VQSGAGRCEVHCLGTRPKIGHVIGQNTGEDHAVQPQIGLQRVLQRAVFHVKSSGKKEVGVVDVLVATFSEKQSGAVFLLTRAQVTRVGVVNYMAGSTGHVLPADAGTKSDGTGSPAHRK